jgi:hypothetical protein
MARKSPAAAILSWLAYMLLKTKPAPGADTPADAGSDGKERM